MRNHAEINGVVFVRGQTAFIFKKLLESLMKDMAAIIMSIDIGIVRIYILVDIIY